MQYIAKKEVINWTHIPFKGGALILTNLLGGHIMVMAGATTWVPHVKEGSLRLLASFTETRLDSFPNIPTLRELGYDISPSAMFLIAAPKGTPRSIIKTLDEAFRKAMDDPDFQQTVAKLEMKVFYRSSENMEKFLNEVVRDLKDLMAELEKLKEPEKK